jgi:CRISPR system Cascade subunit CasA
VNLIDDPWLPVRRRSGASATIRPADVTASHDTDPIVALDWPRADLRIAGLEFLLGLLATACAPDSEAGWVHGWRVPPSPDLLQAAFAGYAHAFMLDGDGPRFMQDFELLVGDDLPIERLLIEIGSSTPGANTDLMARQGRVHRMGRAATAMALFTLQCWAPPGGRGNRTGLRGAGPMTTLAIPRTGDGSAPSLWQVLWANVPQGCPPAPADLPRVFPWLAPTITSEGAAVVTPQSAHPLQCWWGMPRRIRLAFESAPEAAACDLTGAADTVLATGWVQRPNGAKYAAWDHPASPHRQPEAGGEWLPVHPQPAGIGYRDWLGLVLAHPAGTRRPAATIAAWRDGRAENVGIAMTTLLAAGYDMDKMKARGFVEAELPLPAASDRAVRLRLDDAAGRLVLGAEHAADLLRQGLRAALFGVGATVKFDATIFAAARERFWQATEPSFHSALHDTAAGAEDVAVAESWRGALEQTVLALFDEAAPIPLDSDRAAPRISRARRQLRFALRGYGKAGAALFSTIGLPSPEVRPARKGKAA